MSGCLIVFLVFSGLGVLGVATCAGAAILARKSPAEEARENAVNAEIAATAASAKAKAEADLEVSFRKSCKREKGGAIYPIYDKDLKAQCERMVSNALKVPGSGQFPDDSNIGLTTDDGCRRILTETYEAKNAFGVQIRSRFQCTYDPRTGDATIKDLD